MNKEEIIDYLNDNDIYNIEEIEYNEDVFPIKIYYEFDEEEILAAKTYAEEEDSKENIEDGEEEEDLLYKPYLNDISRDNVEDILEELKEDLDIEAQYICYDDAVDNGVNEFIVVFYEKGKNVDIDEIIEFVY
ncbi:TPA: hypothetical protein PTV74_001699 [Clostridium botulinum]|uniref:hypothetical protein n=1 Tax=Clostridium botulinum TaxID=1491 RepID=UPI000D0E0C1D|nr:hypothetical protein [Clostridium botulinum]PSL99043.1 hypothetical protein C6C12_13255 [Clostridium botulinum]HDK7137930.1 hypothetical protein [Clostridium botulinum]HDK7141258.1 hypothetical protein [Clostridium botulinum]HDK7145081.1 hypothetical protein [Clostridium botulinum]HDK7148733.1 hypothetical protein [Clostridium botulinum]